MPLPLPAPVCVSATLGSQPGAVCAWIHDLPLCAGQEWPTRGPSLPVALVQSLQVAPPSHLPWVLEPVMVSWLSSMPVPVPARLGTPSSFGKSLTVVAPSGRSFNRPAVLFATNLSLRSYQGPVPM